MKKLTVLFILIIFSISLFGINIIANPGFENWTGGTPDDWTTIDSGINPTQENVAENVYEGNSSCAMEVTTGSQKNTDFRQTVHVTEGTEYTISLRYKNTEGHLKIRFYVGTYDNTYSDNTTTGWQEYTWSYTASADEDIPVGLRFYDQTDFDGNEIIYIDNFVMDDGTTLPVELSSFSATFTNENYVNLNWITQTETDFMGFDVLRSLTENSTDAIKLNATLIAGTNTSQENSYNFMDSEVEMNQTYYYWLRILNNNGTSELSQPITVKTFGNNDTPDVPEATKLGNAYPNPFNPETNIDFSVSENSNVNLSIYNVLGQKVRTFYNREMKAGNYSVTWRGLDENNLKCSSGIYFYILKTNNYKSIKKMLLLK